MVKKPKSLSEKQSASAAGLFDSDLASTIKESAQQIWLAGLGAFSKAQAEGGKVFEALVKEGSTLQRKTQTAAEDKLGEVSSKMSSMAGDVTARAGQQWDRLEAIFEERTAKAMGRLGVPTRKELDALTARVDALAAKLGKAGAAAKAGRTAASSGAARPGAKAATKSAAKTPAKRARGA